MSLTKAYNEIQTSKQQQEKLLDKRPAKCVCRGEDKPMAEAVLNSRYPAHYENNLGERPSGGALDPLAGRAFQDAEVDYYSELRRVLNEALENNIASKGTERHGAGAGSWDEQSWASEVRLAGAGYPVGQIIKKANEAFGMIQRGDQKKAVHELRGVIGYAAILIRAIEKSLV